MYILCIWENREYIVLIPKCLVLLRIWNACCNVYGFTQADFISWQVATSQLGVGGGGAGCVCSVFT